MTDNQIVRVDARAITHGKDAVIETYDNREVVANVALAKALLPCGKNCSTVELGAFLAWCVSNRYDPFRNQAHLIKYNASDPAAFVVSYWVFVERAQTHPQFDGMEVGIIWDVGGKREWGSPVQYTMDKGHQIAGSWAKVHRKDRAHPFKVEVPWAEMAQYKRDGSLNKTWAKQPTTMATKVALSRAMRLAFAEEFAGQYTDVEYGTREQLTDQERTARMEAAMAEADANAARKPADEPAGAATGLTDDPPPAPHPGQEDPGLYPPDEDYGTGYSPPASVPDVDDPPPWA